MHIEIAPSRAKLLSSRGTTLELYCLASTDIRLSSAREPSRAITLRQSPARRSRVSRERLASFVTFLVSGTVVGGGGGALWGHLSNKFTCCEG